MTHLLLLSALRLAACKLHWQQHTTAHGASQKLAGDVGAGAPATLGCIIGRFCALLQFSIQD
jgi:hypothetical protein